MSGGIKKEGKPKPPFSEQIIEMVLAHFRLERRALLAPIRQETVERNRIDYGAGQNMGADL